MSLRVPLRAALLLLLLVPALPAAARRTRAHLARPARGVQVRVSPFEVRATAEREVCQAATVRLVRPIDVDRVEVVMPHGRDFTSHHLAVFLYTGDDAARLPSTPVDSPGCLGVGDQGVGAILAFVQRPRQVIGFPAGVGLRLEPGQPLLLNSHFVNGAAAPIEPDVAVNFRAAPRGRVVHHARSFQLGTVRIDVPPQASGRAIADWTAPFAMNVVWLTTHSHKHTTAARIEVLRRGVSAGEEVLTTSYSEPAVRRYARPLRLEPGDGLRWSCDYDNRTDRRLRFGVTSEDEMCFAVGFFYPDDDDALLPSVPGCFGAGKGLVCPGN